MASKGSVLKSEIIKKILETFPNSFTYNDGKEVRINGMEDGAPLQIKVTFTTAKVAVENENEEIPVAATADVKPVNTNENVPQEPSDEEKETLKILLDRLGL